jgi:hypothetical protein
LRRSAQFLYHANLNSNTKLKKDNHEQ